MTAVVKLYECWCDIKWVHFHIVTMRFSWFIQNFLSFFFSIVHFHIKWKYVNWKPKETWNTNKKTRNQIVSTNSCTWMKRLHLKLNQLVSVVSLIYAHKVENLSLQTLFKHFNATVNGLFWFWFWLWIKADFTAEICFMVKAIWYFRKLTEIVLWRIHLKVFNEMLRKVLIIHFMTMKVIWF